MKGIFKYKNGNIHYNDQGNGRALVLVHGYLETSEVWRSIAGKLALKFRVITIDLPGHGKSSIYGEEHTMEFMAAVILELMKSLGINEIFLTGHSMGGYVTLAFADLYPEYLAGYCLFHSHPFADSPEVLKKREMEIRLIKAGKRDTIIPNNISKMFAAPDLHEFSAALKSAKKIASGVPGDGIIALLKGLMKRSTKLSVMESGRVPYLWILGAMDNYINCEQIQTKIRLPENADLFILKNSGHLGFIEEEDLSLTILESFINKLPRPSRSE